MNYYFKKIKLMFCVSLLILAFLLSSCSNTGTGADTGILDDSETSADTKDTSADTTEKSEQTTDAPEVEVPSFVIAEKGKTTDFALVIPSAAIGTTEVRGVMSIHDTIKEKFGVKIAFRYDNIEESNNEIIVASALREECAEIMDDLLDEEYVITVLHDDETDKTKVIIAYKNYTVGFRAIKHFIAEFVKNDKLAIPQDFYYKGYYKDPIITSTIECLRDPCILVEDGVYYAYGTGWVCYKNTSGSLAGEWEYLDVVAEIPAESMGDHWAPEVHKYNGAFYMFTTYRSSETGRHGCTILKSDSPEGPFVEITDGTITPKEWDSIDGTLYIDDDGQPWMIFVREWVSTDDGVGRMAAAKMSDDLTHFVSEPIELFRARDAVWSRGDITDGCWLYRCEDGQLLMLWSNWDSAGYAVGVARSVSGKVDGEWTHDEALLYSKNLSNTYEGGHGMIFTDTDGQLYLAVHSPNAAEGSRREAPTFVAIKEVNSTLVWDTDRE